MKKYLSELISNVIGNNVELCEKVICDYRAFLSNPYAVVSKAIDDSVPFSKTEDEVAHDIWLSQVRIVYPVLEDFREGFVKKHRRDISRNLLFHHPDFELAYTRSILRHMLLGALAHLRIPLLI